MDDVAAFCRRVQPRLIGLLSLYCGDREVAEEMTQETLARVWADRRKVSRMANPDGWAYKSALNLARSHFRRRAAERRARQRLSPGRPRLPADEADAMDVRRAVAGLPHRQRAAVVLRYYADLPVSEAAQLMGCAEGTVRALTHQAIASLRAHGGLLREEPADEH